MDCPNTAEIKELMQLVQDGHAQRLGAGGFGEVYKVGNYVAKRVIIKDQFDIMAYNAEVKTWKALTAYSPLKPYLPVYCGSNHIKIEMPPAPPPINTSKGSVTRQRAEIGNWITAVYGKPQAYAFIVQKYEPVRDLYDRLEEWKTTPLDAGNGLQLFNALVSGFNIFHNAGYIHRDIKPANILIRERDLSPIIVDFGLACKADECETYVAGTMSYLPQNLLEKNDEDRVNNVCNFPVVPEQVGFLEGLRRTMGCSRGSRRSKATSVHVKLSDKLAHPTYNRASDRYSLSLVLKELVDVIDWAEYGEWKQECVDLIKRYRAGVVPFLAASSVKRVEGGRKTRRRCRSRRHSRRASN